MSGTRRERGGRPRLLGPAAVATALWLALSMAVLPGAAEGGGGMRGPSRFSATRPPLQSEAPRFGSGSTHGHSVGTGAFMGLLSFYRNVISPVDGDRCSMAPTCSLYSHRALQEHGVLLGVLLTADRLLHEADEPVHGHKIVIGGETYYYDPIEANTYWLR